MWLTCTECGRQSSHPKHCISAVSKVDMCDILWIMDWWSSSSCIPSRPIETKDPPDGGQATQTGLRDEWRTHPHSSTVHKPSQHFYWKLWAPWFSVCHNVKEVRQKSISITLTKRNVQDRGWSSPAFVSLPCQENSVIICGPANCNRELN